MASETHTGELAAGTTAHTEVAGGEAHGAFPPFDTTTFPSQLLWLAITFGLFYYLMTKMVAPRIGTILENRRDRIASDIAEAGSLKQQTDTAIADYEQALAEARKKAHAIAQATREKLNAETEAKRATVEKDLNAKLAAAEEKIAGVKNAALADVGTIAEETASAVIEALLGKAPTKGDVEKAVSASMS